MLDPYTITALAGTFALAAFGLYFAVRCYRLEQRIERLEAKDENKLVRPIVKEQQTKS